MKERVITRKKREKIREIMEKDVSTKDFLIYSTYNEAKFFKIACLFK